MRQPGTVNSLFDRFEEKGPIKYVTYQYWIQNRTIFLVLNSYFSFPNDYFCFIGENDFFGKCTVVLELVVDPAE